MPFERTLYNFNDRFVLNDSTTDPNRYALVGDLTPLGNQAEIESTTITIETDRPLAEGIIDFGSKISGGEFSIPVVLFATSIGHMNDLTEDLRAAFNPQIVNDDPTWGKGNIVFPGGDGFMPMTWEQETGTGTRDVQVFVKPLEVPVFDTDSMAGRVRKGTIKMRIEDPRKYSQVALELENGGTATNGGNYRTPLLITIEAQGGTSSNLSITNDTNGESIELETALSGNEVLVIDTRHQSVKLDGVETRSKITSDSDWIHLEPGDNTITVSNLGNDTATLAWYDAYSI